MSGMPAHPDGPPSERAVEGFTRWLKMKQAQETPAGAFARIVMEDPFWPDPQSRAEVLDHLRQLGVRGFIIQVASECWTEYENWVAKGKGKQRARARNKRAKAARRQNRAASGGKRKR